MEPFAVGFMILVAGAAFMGVVVGAIGGAMTWRLRSSLALGGLLTACAFLLVLILEHPQDFLWLRAKLTWGVPATSLTFLICSVSAPWLKARTALRPTWIALAALGFTLSVGFLYLLLFRISMQAPLVAALLGDICLIFLLMRNRRLVAP